MLLGCGYTFGKLLTFSFFLLNREVWNTYLPCLFLKHTIYLSSCLGWFQNL